MPSFETHIQNLPEQHQNALRWFFENQNNEQFWPQPLPDGTLLCTASAGIYKPKWSQYALSIRESINSEYPDRNILVRDDGTWSYEYYQENLSVEEVRTRWRNKALNLCIRDRIPIGVFREIPSTGKKIKYKIQGVAIVESWNDGYYLLEGFANDGTASVLRRSPQSLENIFKAEDDLKDKRYFNPRNLEDARERNFVSIVRRRGQAKFRRKLIEIYNGKCCITGSDALEALEAAHIIPFLGPETNHHQNGLLLRSDVHNLFDLGLIAIDSTDYSVVIDRDLEATSYQNLSGVQINLPEEPDHHPQKQALEQHRMWAGI